MSWLLLYPCTRTLRPPSSCSRSAVHTRPTESSWWEESQSVSLNVSKLSWSWCQRWVYIAEIYERLWFIVFQNRTEPAIFSPLFCRHQSKVVLSLMTLISTMRRTTMVVSPCYMRREAGDPSADSPFVYAGALSACHPFAATDLCLPPEGTTMTWAPVGVLHRRWAEVEEGAAEHVTCLFLRRRRQEEGEERPTYSGCFNALVVFGCLKWTLVWLRLWFGSF